MNSYSGIIQSWRDSDDFRMMSLAVHIAESNVDTITNQAVGAVLLDKEGNIVGTGCRHIFLNMPDLDGNIKDHKCIHAEHMALMEAGIVKASGGTLYVTTEPCTKRWHNSISHHFPPCCELIVKYGIRCVVIAADDNGFGGGGAEYLTNNNIIVVKLNKFAEYVDNISNRKVDPKVTTEYEEFKRLINEQNIR